jgi:hypothetical protein
MPKNKRTRIQRAASYEVAEISSVAQRLTVMGLEQI